MVSIKDIVLPISDSSRLLKQDFLMQKKKVFILKLFKSLPRDKYIYFLMGSRGKNIFL